jgi:transposase-like protein
MNRPGPELLAALYVGRRLSMQAVAQAFEVSRHTVDKWLTEAGIPKRGRGSQPGVPRTWDEAERTRYEEGLASGASIKQIADADGVGYHTLRQRLIKYELWRN